jgi:hypothetical protein
VQGGYFSPCPTVDAVLPRDSFLGWLLPIAATLAGGAGVCAAWVAIGALSGSSSSWIALVAALDIALMLRLTHAPAGVLRNALALAATGATIVASQWLLAAARVGVLVGLEPLASASRLGPALGWQVVQLSLDRVDWVLLLAALPFVVLLVEERPAARTPAD